METIALPRVREPAARSVPPGVRVAAADASPRLEALWARHGDEVRAAQRLRHRLSTAAELGRSCVDADWRSGTVILLLWSTLAGFMNRHGLRVMIGCASVPMRDGGHAAASLWRQLQRSHLAPLEHRVRPRLPLPVDELRSDLPVEPPALIKGYLRCGARVLGAPAWDPDFGTADLPLMLDLNDLPAAYRRRFIGA